MGIINSKKLCLLESITPVNLKMRLRIEKIEII